MKNRESRCRYKAFLLISQLHTPYDIFIGCFAKFGYFAPCFRTDTCITVCPCPANLAKFFISKHKSDLHILLQILAYFPSQVLLLSENHLTIPAKPESNEPTAPRAKPYVKIKQNEYGA